jgi:hypothetical protein
MVHHLAGFTVSQATDLQPHGQISTGGLLGSSDHSLADFFQIGSARTISSTLPMRIPCRSVGPCYTARAAATGIATKSKCAGTSHEAGGNGHKRQAWRPGPVHFNYDDSNQPTGSASRRLGSGVNFSVHPDRQLPLTTSLHRNPNGIGTDNGSPVALPLSARTARWRPQGFSITLSDGYNSSGNLLDGSIAVTDPSGQRCEVTYSAWFLIAGIPLSKWAWGCVAMDSFRLADNCTRL